MSDDQQDTKPEGEQITIRVRDQVSYLVICYMLCKPFGADDIR
jgi:hypothetical protein